MGFSGGWEVREAVHFAGPHWQHQQLLKPVSQERTLTQLAIREGFESDRRGEGVVYVGVDSRYSFLYSPFHADVSLMLVSGWIRPKPYGLGNNEGLARKLEKIQQFAFFFFASAASSPSQSLPFSSLMDPVVLLPSVARRSRPMPLIGWRCISNVSSKRLDFTGTLLRIYFFSLVFSLTASSALAVRIDQILMDLGIKCYSIGLASIHLSKDKNFHPLVSQNKCPGFLE